MSYIPPPPFRDDIDFGATPTRTTKPITMRIEEVTLVEDAAMGGVAKKYTSTVDVHIFVRDVSMLGNRREPQDLIDMEKYIVEYIALNELNFIDQGISNVMLSGVRSFIDEEYASRGVWYHTVVTFIARYYMIKT